MNWHGFGLWAMFFLGELTYMSMRAHFMVRGPRPVATGYIDFIKRAWGPLIFRLGFENAIFVALLNPELAEAGLKALGWETFAFYCTLLRFFPIAYLAGMAGDVIADFGVVKAPYFKDVWPQMPPPLTPEFTSSEQAERNLTTDAGLR